MNEMDNKRLIKNQEIMTIKGKSKRESRHKSEIRR